MEGDAVGAQFGQLVHRVDGGRSEYLISARRSRSIRMIMDAIGERPAEQVRVGQSGGEDRGCSGRGGGTRRGSSHPTVRAGAGPDTPPAGRGWRTGCRRPDKTPLLAGPSVRTDVGSRWVCHRCGSAERSLLDKGAAWPCIRIVRGTVAADGQIPASMHGFHDHLAPVSLFVVDLGGDHMPGGVAGVCWLFKPSRAE